MMTERQRRKLEAKSTRCMVILCNRRVAAFRANDAQPRCFRCQPATPEEIELHAPAMAAPKNPKRLYWNLVRVEGAVTHAMLSTTITQGGDK